MQKHSAPYRTICQRVTSDLIPKTAKSVGWVWGGFLWVGGKTACLAVNFCSICWVHVGILNESFFWVGVCFESLFFLNVVYFVVSFAKSLKMKNYVN
jgi:hypothetical protein